MDKYTILSIFLSLITICSYAQHTKIKYQLEENGYSISINPQWNNKTKMPRMSHRSDVDSINYDEYFNRAIRRGNTILVTGDEPVFALMKYLKQDKLDPELIKMGDGRIRFKIDNKEEWLNPDKNGRVLFNPGSTEYNCSLQSLEKLTVNLLISQAGDWGTVLKLTCTNTSEKEIELNAGLLYGGIRKCGRTFSASYFSSSGKEDLSRNMIDTLNGYARLYSEEFPGKVFISAIPYVNPQVMGSRVFYEHEMKMKGNSSSTVYFILGQSFDNEDVKEVVKNILMAKPGGLVEESENYYKKILMAYSISTPSKILDAGFKTAILNFDNIHADSAWLEGVHWWASYWTNNYQISAATSLGQLENVKKALLFYDTKEYGPAPTLMISGKPFVDFVRQGAEDGIPYYLYALIQYYNASGDIALLKGLWPSIRKSLTQFFALRDPDGNGLLNWHMGANAFMYQADHLGMPGDAASPSLMMAGMLENLSKIAKKIREDEDASHWKNLSGKMYVNLKKILWDERSGTFYNHKDLQGIRHTGHYYTDLVFPGLYTTLSKEYSWQSLDYLYRALWTNNYKGENTLMHVGDFKPSIFGNDNVMPVQMAEAARAYFKEGDYDKGIKLMESVALAATIFTEAPGSFPERMNDEGKGEANYLFGNPVGSFMHAAVNGLFGIGLEKDGEELDWHPSFPAAWNNASIHLPYATAGFKKYINDNGIINIEYNIIHNKMRLLHFSVFVEPGEIVNLFCNGKKVNYELSTGLGKIKIDLNAGADTSHVLLIQYKRIEIKLSTPDLIYPNAKVKWTSNLPIEKVEDPQHLLSSYTISNNTINGKINTSTGFRQLFVKIKNMPVVYPVSLEIKPSYDIHCVSSVYDAGKQKIFLNIYSSFPSLQRNNARLKIKLIDTVITLKIRETPNNFQTTGIFYPRSVMPAGVYIVEYVLQNDGKAVYTTKENIYLTGADGPSARLMDSVRQERTMQLDISNQFNTDTIYAFTEWRNANLIIDSNYFSFVSDSSKRILSEFKVKSSGYNMAMINYGISDQYTRKTKRSHLPQRISFPVNKKCQVLSLLFFNEMETRLTHSAVGSLTLSYKDGSNTILPLIVGQNIDALSKYFAPALKPVRMKETDYAKIYDVPVDGRKELKSFTIKLIAADMEVGVMAANVILSGK